MEHEVFDFTNNDPDESVFSTLTGEVYPTMEVEQSELDSLGIQLVSSLQGPQGIYIQGNGIPDVIINDYETGVRTPNYRYKIEVYKTQENPAADRCYREIVKYLSDLLEQPMTESKKKSIKESRVAVDSSSLTEFITTIHQYFDDGLGDPIVKRRPVLENGVLKPFTYIEFDDHQSGTTFEVSLDGEYEDEIWIHVDRLYIGGKTRYVMSCRDSSDQEIYWSGLSVEELKKDLDDCFYHVAIPARKKVTESKKKINEGSGDIYINAHMYHGIPVMDVTVNDERIYSSDWESLDQARAAAADLRAFLHNRVGGIKELINTWDHTYVPGADDEALYEARVTKFNMSSFDLRNQIKEYVRGRLHELMNAEKDLMINQPQFDMIFKQTENGIPTGAAFAIRTQDRHYQMKGIAADGMADMLYWEGNSYEEFKKDFEDLVTEIF